MPTFGVNKSQLPNPLSAEALQASADRIRGTIRPSSDEISDTIQPPAPNLAKSNSDTIQPWFLLSSPCQGMLTGIIIAQGGFSALFLLLLLPFLDVAAISRIHYLIVAFSEREKALKISPLRRPGYDRSISWLSAIRPIGCVALNLTLATVFAPLIAPYSPMASATKTFFNKVIAMPATYSTLNELDKSTSFLLGPEQKYWLRDNQVSLLETKKLTLEQVKRKKTDDEYLRGQARRAISTDINEVTYKQILSEVTSLPLHPRFKIVLTKQQQHQVIGLRPKVQAFSSEVDLRKREEQAREMEKVAAEKARWGVYYENSELKNDAISSCKNSAFEKTGQSKNWFFDDRGLDFNIAPIGSSIWVGGPFKVEIAGGNLDGSKRITQVGVDCYFDKNSTNVSGTIQVDW